MIYVLGKFFQSLFAPFLMSLFCQAAALWCLLRKRRGAKAWLIGSLALILPFSVPVLPFYLLSKLERKYPVQPVSAYPTADAIVVLGGSVSPIFGDRLQPEELGESEGRILMATRLFRAKKAARVLAVGGGKYTDSAGAWRMGSADMRDVLVAMGVPNESVIEIPGTRSTREDVTEATKYMKQRGWRSALLVTSAFHMARALDTFADRSIALTPVPTAIQFASYRFSLYDLVPEPCAQGLYFTLLKETIGRGVARGLRHD